MVLVRVFELGQDVAHRIEAGALLVVGLNGDPRGLIRVRVAELLFLRAGVVIPLIQGCLLYTSDAADDSWFV